MVKNYLVTMIGCVGRHYGCPQAVIIVADSFERAKGLADETAKLMPVPYKVQSVVYIGAHSYE